MTSASADRAPWDQRLAERLARQAREAANDPAMYERVPLREQIKSPYYWLAIVAGGAAGPLSLLAKDGWAGALAAGLPVVGFVAVAIDMRRRSSRRRAATARQPKERRLRSRA